MTLILSHYLPAEPGAITDAEWEARARAGFTGTVTAGRDGLRRVLPRAAVPGPTSHQALLRFGSGQHVEVGQHLGRADTDHQFTWHRVTPPELLRAIGSHVTRRERG